MKLTKRFTIAAAALLVGVLGGAQRSQAQASGVQPLWANYAVQYVNQFYNPLAGANLISADSFVNFNGVIDHDDGTYAGWSNNSGLPVGFSFDYNGNTYSTVNVNVNGWASVGKQPLPINPNNNNNLYNTSNPGNALAPYWGDHYYRTLEPGYHPTRISYLTTAIADTNPNAAPGSLLHIFTVEWKDLNINDKTNPQSIASFQLRIIENSMANDPAVPDHRATIEFQYGPNGWGSTVSTVGAAVGAKDSVGFTHINALYATSQFSGDSTRLNVAQRSSCWPPATCLPGRAIQLVPQGRASLNQWGDGDVNLDQIYNKDAAVRNNQARFVTLTDANIILTSRANNVKLDSIEGHAAFHGDANHTGRVYNPTYGAYFYYVTSYDAAYIMMYLAAKLPVLPWPVPLPVPGYKASNLASTDVSGIVADASNVHMTGNTMLVPITVRGTVNGALSLEMNVKGLNSNDLQFVGTRSVNGSLIQANATTGKIALATSGSFEDGTTIGYLEFNVANKANASFEMSDVMVNDQQVPGSTVALKFATGSNAASSSLEQNVPNPFVAGVTSHTTIGFTLAAPTNVTLRVYDMLGHEVRTLVRNEDRAAGANSIEWDGRDANGNVVASGLYYYQIVTPDFTQSVKMQVVR